jgi:hypothetical protein
MSTIIQSGNNNQSSAGNHSPNISGNRNKIGLPDKKNISWFVSGIILPILTGLILEIIKQGKVSELFSSIIRVFAK